MMKCFIVIFFGVSGVLAGLAGNEYMAALHVVILSMMGNEESTKALLKLYKEHIHELENMVRQSAS